jgi:hypothetical protein
MLSCAVQMVVGDDVGNVQVLRLQETEEVQASEIAEDVEESKAAVSVLTPTGLVLVTSPTKVAAAAGAGSEEFVPDDGELDINGVTAEETSHPRAPVTNARKLFIPDMCVLRGRELRCPPRARVVCLHRVCGSVSDNGVHDAVGAAGKCGTRRWLRCASTADRSSRRRHTCRGLLSFCVSAFASRASCRTSTRCAL